MLNRIASWTFVRHSSLSHNQSILAYFSIVQILSYKSLKYSSCTNLLLIIKRKTQNYKRIYRARLFCCSEQTSRYSYLFFRSKQIKYIFIILFWYEFASQSIIRNCFPYTVEKYYSNTLVNIEALHEHDSTVVNETLIFNRFT